MSLEQWACATGGDVDRCPSYPMSLPHYGELDPDAVLDHAGRECVRCGKSLVACFRLGCDAPASAFLELIRGPLLRHRWRASAAGRDTDEYCQDVTVKVIGKIRTDPAFDPRDGQGRLEPLAQLVGAQVRFAAQDVLRVGLKEDAKERRRIAGSQIDVERGARSALPTVDGAALTVTAADLREAFALVHIVLDEFPSTVRPEFEAWMNSVRAGRGHGSVADAARAVHGTDDNTTRKRVGRHVEDVVAQLRDVFAHELHDDDNAALRLLLLWGIALDEDLEFEPGWREGGAA
ncbi:hypothetical protein [Nocardioides sp. WS12]|uniref:hypothetical protein n=1 Tax=Nocardioides sp. WS12 TaxID=2486272 RepID=UPI0015FA0BA6|nr:hypothetical protein [Nocardioides sp. WS12]